MKGINSIPVPEIKRIRKSVEAALEKYRIYKYLIFAEREAAITSSYDLREGGASNKTSDQTGSIAVHNVDAQDARRAYCERIESAVGCLPIKEKILITERYMGRDSEYITDYSIYCHRFDPPISPVTYSRIRERAIYKLALMLGLGEGKADESN